MCICACCEQASARECSAVVLRVFGGIGSKSATCFNYVNVWIDAVQWLYHRCGGYATDVIDTLQTGPLPTVLWLGPGPNNNQEQGMFYWLNLGFSFFARELR